MRTATLDLGKYKNADQPVPYCLFRLRNYRFVALWVFLLCGLVGAPQCGFAQVNDVGQRPYLGWSTFSEQTIVPSSSVMNEQNILGQSDAMRSSGLEAHGFRYINLDAGWSGNSDQYGRTLWNTTAFPHFLDMIQHIHANGQKIGIYLLPGIGTSVYSQNLPIFGTQYHAQDIVALPLTVGNGFGYGYKIDFTKPGAQEYINSIITLYASWGIDFLKLDSLEVGNGATDGITNTEKQTAMTLWAMANAPLYLGGDLTNLTTFGKQLLTNDEVLAVDQSGHPAKQATGGFTPVWVSNLGNGSYYVAIFNLNAFPTNVTVDWKDLGFLNAVGMRDLWSHAELGPFFQSFSGMVPAHGARLFKVKAVGQAPVPPSQIYGAATATLHGGAQLSSCSTCASGYKLTYLGIGAANYAIFNVSVPKAGVYRMEVDSMTTGTRSFIINVNDGPNITLNLSGGSSNLPFPTTIPVRLNAGMNSIEFGNPTSYPPDMDRIIISGDGNEPYPDFSGH